MTNNNSIEKALHAGSKKLFLIFGGIAGAMAMPPFEFFNSSRIINENKIFIRDLNQCYYQAGLAGISTDINSTADYLKNEIAQIDHENLYFIGNCAGGFAAIMFSALLGCGETIAFAPLTFIDPINRIRFRDFRNTRKKINTYIRTFTKRKIYDLKTLLKTTSPMERNIQIFVGSNYRVDYVHSARLANIHGVTIHEIKTNVHSVVKVLRDQGKLAQILEGSYQENDAIDVQ